jgi:hypothetical protein
MPFNPISDLRCVFLSYLLSYVGQKAGLLYSVRNLEPILLSFKTYQVMQDTDVYKDNTITGWKLAYYEYLF